ncbi:acyltransferase [Adhaeribacter rhizoryzae]|uniref:Acyltransferase n=1 Tax=Adhaeribacter rhizoryzae TaxID=2607907 RepID=A0A5M6DNJ0_9BACT|nr:acyltransferase [Adhaeribacter rhizoryzae]KAA5549057.1 acyltransferase [Adhaeribacter rhizoryzae]
MQKEHLPWVDVLRVLACLLVIISHACGPFVGHTDKYSDEFLAGAYMGSLVRSCVPLFVMISGVLLLPVTTDMTTFYAKRLKKLILPFVFWSLMLPILFYLYVNSGLKNINSNLLPADYTWQTTIQKMYTFVFNFNYDTTALWYVYMLIGLYLFMPIISAWLKQASKRDLHWFLLFWIISMGVPYLEIVAPHFGYTGNYGNRGVLGVSFWNAFGTFYYFAGFLGYLVLAFYLIKYPLNWSWRRTLAVAIPLFLVGYAVTTAGFILIQQYFPGSYASLEIIWYFYGINVILMTLPIFMVIQKSNPKARPWLSKMAALSFGIFLCHYIFVHLSYDFVSPLTFLPAFVKIILIAIISFVISLLVSWLLSLNNITRKVIM